MNSLIEIDVKTGAKKPKALRASERQINKYENRKNPLISAPYLSLASTCTRAHRCLRTARRASASAVSCSSAHAISASVKPRSRDRCGSSWAPCDGDEEGDEEVDAAEDEEVDEYESVAVARVCACHCATLCVARSTSHPLPSPAEPLLAPAASSSAANSMRTRVSSATRRSRSGNDCSADQLTNNRALKQSSLRQSLLHCFLIDGTIIATYRAKNFTMVMCGKNA